MYNHLLDTFIAVVENGSFTKAAETLFISAPAIMKQMNLLEEQLGLTLIERTPQGISLTKSGKFIYQDAKKIIDFSNEAIERADDSEEEETWRIKIGSSLLNPSQQIAGLLNAVRRREPRFSFEIIPFDDDHESIISVLNSIGTDYDLIPGSFTSGKISQVATYVELEKMKFTLAVPTKHPLARKEVLELSDLIGETIISGDTAPNRPVGILQNDLAKNYPGIKQEIIYEFYDITIFNRYDNSDKLLLSLPQWQYIQPNYVTLPVNWKYETSFGLLRPVKPNKAVKKFLEYVAEIQADETTRISFH
ncbi:LysR family transcriptional regulator [Enterococcus sp. HY326]|uniref:LysR family transcriptional regulator n=1 Tax=Enterococcus sp. HY326 TaxID=2971265 RepID=UPI002240AE51|nr:LysR family transcriptional regulator [Enterococcus sp. HY326]